MGHPAMSGAGQFFFVGDRSEIQVVVECEVKTNAPPDEERASANVANDCELCVCCLVEAEMDAGLVEVGMYRRKWRSQR